MSETGSEFSFFIIIKIRKRNGNIKCLGYCFFQNKDAKFRTQKLLYLRYMYLRLKGVNKSGKTHKNYFIMAFLLQKREWKKETRFSFETEQETLRVVTIAMISSTLASLWKYHCFRRPIYNLVEHLWWSFCCKNSKLLNIFTKMPHRRCSVGF